VLVAGETDAITTVDELIRAAKARPGELRFGSTGVGTGTHLGIEKFNLMVGIKAVHVPAKGSDAIADTITNTIAGRTDYALSPIPTSLPHIREGRLLPLGVSSARRSRALPDVPTVAEAGVAGFDFPIWYGIWAPAATPVGVVQKLAEDIARALRDPAVREMLVKHGGDPMTMRGPTSRASCWPRAKAQPGSSKPPGSRCNSPLPQSCRSRRLAGRARECRDGRERGILGSWLCAPALRVCERPCGAFKNGDRRRPGPQPRS
jgi:hypothetical protein